MSSRLERLYEALETSALTLEALSPRILALRHRQDQLAAARDGGRAASWRSAEGGAARHRRRSRRYVADFRALLQRGTFPDRKALLRNFVQGIEVVDDAATLTYTVPMPADGATNEEASVLDFVQSSPRGWTRTSDQRFYRPPL